MHTGIGPWAPAVSHQSPLPFPCVQEVANRLAEESVEACARLAGLDGACPPHDGARKALSALLTPYLARKLGVLPAPELLRILTANTENPYLIWDNGTRAQLKDYLLEQQRSVVRSVRPPSLGRKGSPSFLPWGGAMGVSHRSGKASSPQLVLGFKGSDTSCGDQPFFPSCSAISPVSCQA